MVESFFKFLFGITIFGLFLEVINFVVDNVWLILTIIIFIAIVFFLIGNNQKNTKNNSNKESHKDTGTKYDPDGFNKEGIHKDTGIKYDPDGYDKSGYNKKGFNKEGIHKDTGIKYDPDGYDKNGYNKDGFNRYGTHKDTYTKYNPDGYDIDGYDKKGFNKQGIHKDTGAQYDSDGYDINGFNEQGIHKDTGAQYDSDGYDQQQHHILEKIFNNKKVLLDTNIFMIEDFVILFYFIVHFKIPVILIRQIYEELLHLKKSSNYETAKKAKKGIRIIDQLQEYDLIDIINLGIQSKKDIYADPAIIKLFKNNPKNLLLITNDRDVKIRSKNFVKDQYSVFFGDKILKYLVNIAIDVYYEDGYKNDYKYELGKCLNKYKQGEINSLKCFQQWRELNIKPYTKELVLETYQKTEEDYKNNVTYQSDFSDEPYQKIIDWSNSYEMPYMLISANPILKTPEYMYGMPKDISTLKNMTILALNGLGLKDLPEEIGMLKNLRSLYLQENYLTRIPNSITNLTNLEELSLISNPLEKLPENIGNLKNLKFFYFDAMHMQSIPSSIKELQNIEMLYVSHSANIFDNQDFHEWITFLYKKGIEIQIT